jgi:hypothetical protein
VHAAASAPTRQTMRHNACIAVPSGRPDTTASCVLRTPHCVLGLDTVAWNAMLRPSVQSALLTAVSLVAMRSSAGDAGTHWDGEWPSSAIVAVWLAGFTDNTATRMPVASAYVSFLLRHHDRPHHDHSSTITVKGCCHAVSTKAELRRNADGERDMQHSTLWHNSNVHCKGRDQ